MKILATVVAIVAVLVLPSTASAKTELIMPEGYTGKALEHWIDHSRMPTPNVTVSVTWDIAMCGGEPDEWGGCTNGYFLALRGENFTKFTLWHELGHVVSFRILPEDRRPAYVAFFGRAEWQEESFADLYETCSTPSRVFRLDHLNYDFGRGSGIRLTRQQLNVGCAMLRRDLGAPVRSVARTRPQ